MVGLALLLYIIIRLWVSRRQVRWRGLLGPALAGVVAFGVLVGPVALPSLSLWGGGGLRHSAKAADEHSAAPVDYLLPNELQPLWGAISMRAHSAQNVIENSLYLGGGALVIAIVGWLIARRKRDRDADWVTASAWLVVLVVSIVLSLGLTLHDLGGQVNTGTPQAPVPVTMPGRLLYDWLPLFSSMRAYARFGFIAVLALFALMSMGWAAIVRRAGNRGLWWTVLVVVLLMADFWTAPYAWG